VEPDLIGGAVIRVGDRVMDGSVRRKLKQLRRQLLSR
jgi:F-type H+-transporting ATPase subunit delta